jgi:hypothetical protein
MRGRRLLVVGTLVASLAGGVDAAEPPPLTPTPSSPVETRTPVDAPATPKASYTWREVPGWRLEPPDPAERLPHLGSRVFTIDQARTRVAVSILTLAPGLHAGSATKPGCSLSGVASYDTWLPPNLGPWTPLGAGAAGCFATAAMRPSPDPAYRVFGQVRCRRANFVQVYTFLSGAPEPLATATWRGSFRTLVTKARIPVPCLLPEEMIYLADREGPPFVAVRRTADVLDVAAASMCGSGGCAFYRFRRLDDACWRLVDCNVRGDR